MEMKKEVTASLLVVAAVLLVIGIASLASAAPVPPDSINVSDSQRRTELTDSGAPGKQVSAQAGNVTKLTINVTTLTERWAGFYGNFSATIKLDDANNFSFYRWAGDVAANGEVYAANKTVSNWTGIRCVNLSAAYPADACDEAPDGSCLNIVDIETGFGMSRADGDSINNTFNAEKAEITLDTVGTLNCSAVNLYVNNASDASKGWNVTLLTENNTDTVVFGAKMRNGLLGYNNKAWDFQLLAADNGDTALPTTYFFYVELA